MTKENFLTQTILAKIISLSKMGSISVKLHRRCSTDPDNIQARKPSLSCDDIKLMRDLWQHLKKEISNIGTMTFIW